VMLSRGSAPTSAESQSDLLSELERRVEWLCRRCPEEIRATAAHEEMVELRPRVQEAIEGLENIKERRRLTEEEKALQRALSLLLCAQR
jgi:hypothetical protein